MRDGSRPKRVPTLPHNKPAFTCDFTFASTAILTSELLTGRYNTALSGVKDVVVAWAGRPSGPIPIQFQN